MSGPARLVGAVLALLLPVSAGGQTSASCGAALREIFPAVAPGTSPCVVLAAGVATQSEVVRREPLLWVSSANHATHEQDPLPMAFGRPTCIWRRQACDVLDRMNRDYRVLFTSFSATVITAAVLSGLAISVLPECALRPGMRVLGEAEGFGALPDCRIGIMRGHTARTEIVEALAHHIAESLDNITVPMAAEAGSFDFAALASIRGKRLKPSHILPGW